MSFFSTCLTRFCSMLSLDFNKPPYPFPALKSGTEMCYLLSRIVCHDDRLPCWLIISWGSLRLNMGSWLAVGLAVIEVRSGWRWWKGQIWLQVIITGHHSLIVLLQGTKSKHDTRSGTFSHYVWQEERNRENLRAMLNFFLSKQVNSPAILVLDSLRNISDHPSLPVLGS